MQAKHMPAGHACRASSVNLLSQNLQISQKFTYKSMTHVNDDVLDAQKRLKQDNITKL